MTDTLTKDVLDKELSYDLLTGEFSRLRATQAEKIGGVAGNLAANGRRYISVRGVRYMASHLAVLHMTGALPAGYVKQKNGDYDDCRWDNLYEETPQVSARGSRIQSNNTSGHKGVSFDRKRQRWFVSIRDGYKMIALGRFNTFEEAVAARQRAEATLSVGGSLDIDKGARASALMDARLRRLWAKVLAATANVTGWENFSAFSDDVGPLPEKQSGVAYVDAGRPIGPSNWRRIKKFNRRTADGRSAYNKQQRAENPDRFKNNELKKAFGIGIDRYREMLVAQAGVCAICGQPETMIRRGKIQSLSVDHNHDTDAVRDLLCTSCNAMIGYSRERPDMLRAAATYLECHAEPRLSNIVPLARKETA